MTANTDGEGREEKLVVRLAGLINKAAVRRMAMEYAAGTGRGEIITRVGDSVYAAADLAVRKVIRGLVHRHPSGFRTLEA